MKPLAWPRYNRGMKMHSTISNLVPRVTFLGAAQTVTGSMHLVEFGEQKILLDCGMHRGLREEADLRNRYFPFEPASLDAVILSHAHTDHCGNLPNLVRQGFQGPIYCTRATRDLIALMLADSARIHEEEVLVHAVVSGSPRGPSSRYTRSDANVTIQQCEVLDYHEARQIGPGVQLRLRDAGHILGSALVDLTFAVGDHEYRVVFSGDLGRRGLPYLRQAEPIPSADLLICESTYGGRVHDTSAQMATRLGEVVRRTIERGGKILIPAFSLGRTQLVVYYLQHWMQEGIVPTLPIYVDSPLACQIAGVYRRYAGSFESAPFLENPPVHYLTSNEESAEVSMASGSFILVASGGMCEGGKVLQHLRHHVDDPRSTVVLVSYQAPYSLGQRLLDHKPTVRFHGRTWNKWIEVVAMNGFSGHADHHDFLAYLGPVAQTTGQVCLVHGETTQAEMLALSLRERGFARVAIPQHGQLVSL